MKKITLLKKKIEIFCNCISKHRKNDQKMRIQTDQEFQQNDIKKLNSEFNVTMFSTNVRGSKSFATEQKIREFKQILLKSKRIEKRLGKRIKPNKLIRKATNNLNRIQSVKLGFTPDQVVEKSLESDEFTDLYDFHRLVRVKEAKERIERLERN